jgi:hypothetical protein
MADNRTIDVTATLKERIGILQDGSRTKLRVHTEPNPGTRSDIPLEHFGDAIVALR